MINIDLKDYLNNIDTLRNLERYQTAPRAAKESVAEHSFFVASYVLKLHDYYEFDLAKALTMSILHDFSEAFISDVPRPIKRAFPKLNEELNKAEYQINEQYINEDFAKSITEFNNGSSAEGLIVALSDVLSVVSYSKYEMELGNSKYMQEVYRSAKSRCRKLIEQTDKFLRPNISSLQIMQYIEDFMNSNYM